MEKVEQTSQGFWGQHKRYNIPGMEIPGEEKKREKRKKNF